MDRTTIARCLARLEKIDQPQYRPDTRRAVRSARALIEQLSRELGSRCAPRNSLGRDPEEVALRVAMKAESRPVTLYLSPHGDYRWNRGAAFKGELIGNYKPGIHWQDILEDINAG